MDLNYNVASWDFSLRTMCLVSITHNVLEASRCDPTSTIEPTVIASRATERVQKLDLFPALNSEIKNIIQPVMEEMLDWYTRYGDGVNVILTPHGTVDTIKSTRAFLRSNQPVYERYVVACDFCLHDEIFHLVEEASPYITYNENCTHPLCVTHVDSLAKFWHRVYDGRFDLRISHEDLSAEETYKGYILAQEQSNNTTIQMFLEKASQEAIQLIIYKSLSVTVYYTALSELSPAVYSAIFRIMDVEDLLVKDCISTSLLISLLKWPYQQLFVNAANLVMANLRAANFWYVANLISQKAADGRNDYNYKGLFAAFWQMGSMFYKNDIVRNVSRRCIQPVLENVSLLRNEYIKSLVFDVILSREIVEVLKFEENELEL